MANDKMIDPEKALQSIADGDFRVLDQLARMVEGSYEDSGLDPQTFMLVRIAALTAVDAAPASWLVNLGISKELEIPRELAVGTLIAVAPIVGTARVVSAAGSILRAMVMAKKMQSDSQN